MPVPARCAVCGDELPDARFPEAATCRQYADALARERGDLLPEDLYQSLMLMRLWCRLSATLRDGKEMIDEP
jgi:hypothetical protein